MNRTGRGMMHRLGVRVAALAAAAVLAVFGVFAAGVSVSATETSGSGSITITNPQDGVTYSAYKIFDASYGTKTVDGETQTIVAYTASEAVEAFFTGNSVTGTNPFVFTQNSAGTYNVSIGTNSETGEKYSNTYITQFLAANVASGATSNVFTKAGTSTTTTDSDGNNVITISGLEEGYYFVATTSGAVVAITSLDESATIADKTNYGTPTVEKKVSVSLNGTYYDSIETAAGATVYYKATVTATKAAHGYVLHDTMSSSLTFGSVLKVCVDGEEIDSKNYSWSTSTSDGCTFELTIADGVLGDLTGGEEIVVYYTATVKSDAVAGQSFPNTIYLEYDDPYYWEVLGQEESKKTEEDKATVKIPSSSTTTTDEGGGDDDDDDPDPTPTTTTDGGSEEGGSVLGALRDLVDSLTGGGEEGGSVLGAERLPQTGQLNWPIPVLAASGVILVCIGLMIERKERRYEEK